jgi:hypothetical protein
MRHLLLAAAIAVSSLSAAPAIAQNAGCDSIAVEGLPESVVIDLKKKCIELAKPVTPSVTVDSMGEYAELGKKYGIALSEVAKSIGTTVNELAQTPVGKFMLVMVAYRVMGDGIIGVLGGFTWFTIMLPIWLYMFHRLVLRNVKTRTYTDAQGKPVTERMPVDMESSAGVTSFVMLLVLGVICIAGFIMVF